MIGLGRIAGFGWDDGTRQKSADKHDVSPAEAENLFLNDPLIIAEDKSTAQANSVSTRWGKQPKVACCT